MKAHTIGRVLGIGLRVAGRVAGQRIAAQAPPAAPSPLSRPAADAAARGRAAGEAARGVARGARGFLRPFRLVGGKIWLEVTGVFFLLPVAVFGPNLWTFRASYAQGPGHRTFVASAVVVAVFLYLGASSFWRARRR